MWPRLDKEMCFAYVKGEEKESKQNIQVDRAQNGDEGGKMI